LIELALAFSLHLGLKGDYNGIHPHIRYNHNNYIAGAFYNSERNISTYIGKRWEHNDLALKLEQLQAIVKQKSYRILEVHIKTFLLRRH